MSKNIIKYLEMRRRQPLTGLSDSIHTIHTGTPYEAEITIADLEATIQEISDLRHSFRAVDDEDWDYLLSTLSLGGRGRFWKAVLTEARAALILERARD